MDSTIGLPKLEGIDAIYTIIDYLIKERYYVACLAGDEGILLEATMKILVRYVFTYYRLPYLTVLDRGP